MLVIPRVSMAGLFTSGMLITDVRLKGTAVNMVQGIVLCTTITTDGSVRSVVYVSLCICSCNCVVLNSPLSGQDYQKDCATYGMHRMQIQKTAAHQAMQAL